MIKSIDDTRSLDLLDIKDYGLTNIKHCRYKLVVFDNFSNHVWTIPLKNKDAQSVTDAFSQIIKTSKRKPKLLGTDDGKEFVKV